MSDYGAVFLKPGHTYWWNLRLTSGCVVYDSNGTPVDDPSACQPMIHVQRPK